MAYQFNTWSGRVWTDHFENNNLNTKQRISFSNSIILKPALKFVCSVEVWFKGSSSISNILVRKDYATGIWVMLRVRGENYRRNRKNRNTLQHLPLSLIGQSVLTFNSYLLNRVASFFTVLLDGDSLFQTEECVTEGLR